jgi:multiple sugar transport system substrate-binding protein
MKRLRLLLPVVALVVSLLVMFGSITQAAAKFNWQRYKGAKIRLLLNKHNYTDAMLADLKNFENLTGIKVTYDIFPEENYFDKVTIDLSSGQGSYDVFMTGAYMIWQYAPPGWMEPLNKYMNDPSMTSPDWDVKDIYPNLLGADSWSLKVGDPVGTGKQWALPWAFETNALMYRKDLFEKFGLTAPKTFQELTATAKKLTTSDMAGIVVRGTKNWATIHPGYMTMYASSGLKDFDKKMNPVMNSPKAVAMTDEWVKMVRESGPKAWTTYTWYQAGSDLGAGKAAMMFDADILGYFNDVPGSSAMAGKFAWAPGPRGPKGDLNTNMWIWSLAMNAKSKNKGSAWYFLQWATGKEHLTTSAVKYAMVDPVRKSIWNNPQFKQQLASHTNFYETFQEVISGCSIQFTPQPIFFETTTEWAASLQDIYYEKDTAKNALDKLVQKIKRMMLQKGIRPGKKLGK